MTKRFQIEDIIDQDTEGITFRALDTQTDSMVAVRRFFPFGADGGGLHDEQQATYNAAISILTGLSHPALRKVVSGGCDPIDGIPYIATEWIEGDVLQAILDNGPLPAEAAVVLLTQALEVCELLSQARKEEAIWVETDLQTIVLANEASNRGFTFWISPLKWLGGDEHSRRFGTIATLTEEIMGWENQSIPDEAGNGLGRWIKWLRGIPQNTPLREVREALAASVGLDPQTVTTNLMIKAPIRPVASPAKTKQTVKNKPAETVRAEPYVLVEKPSSGKKWMIVALVLLMLVGLGEYGWYVHRSRQAKNTDDSAGQVRGSLQDFSTIGHTDAQTHEIIAWDNNTLLTQSSGKTVTVEGVAKSVTRSVSGKTYYLLFADDSEKSAVRAGMEVNQENPDAIKKTFNSLVGKKIHATGNVVIRATPGNSRPEVMAKNLSAIKAVD